MRKFIKRFWNDDRGQSTTEYILILAVVVMIAMKFKNSFQGRMDKIVDNVGNQIDQAAANSN
jgi:Flp pilus assembly pilin Flp